MADAAPLPPSISPPEGPPAPAHAAGRGRRRGKRWRTVLISAGAIVILAAFALWKASGPSSAGGSADDELTYTVARGPMTISFSERGTIKAAKSEQVFSKLEGVSTIVNVVSEGSFVKKGDLLVELDSSELTQLLNQQNIAVDTAAAALTTANAQVEIQKSQNESDIQAARLALELAKIDKEKYEKGDYRLAYEKAMADIDIAKEEMTRAQNKLQWTEKLAEKGYVTKTELIADQIAEHKAKVQAVQAEKGLEVLESYTKKKDSMKVSSDLEQAERAFDRVQRKAGSLIAQAQADQKGKQSTHNLSQRRLNKIRDQIEKTKIMAPQDGMVVYFQEGRWGRDDRLIEQGATVRENQHLIDLPDLSVMAVSVQVPEARIHQVKVGLTATVTIDAQSEMVLRGTVTKIGLLPDYVNRWMNPDLKVYATDVTIDPYQDTRLLRPGMSAKVEILVEQIDDALSVPIQSVTTIDGQQVCFIRSGEEFKSRKVEVGQSNNSFIQILTGLEVADVVQLNAPRPQGTAPARKEKEARPDEPPGGGDGFPAPGPFKDGDGGRRQGKRRGPNGESGESPGPRDGQKGGPKTISLDEGAGGTGAATPSAAAAPTTATPPAGVAEPVTAPAATEPVTAPAATEPAPVPAAPPPGKPAAAAKASTP
jgi:HlyD family secretion protein